MRVYTHTWSSDGSEKSSRVAILPYTGTSSSGCSPSGVSRWISILVYLAMMRESSVGEVKCPTTEWLTAVGF